MPSVFTKIVRGELSCWRVAEDDKCLAFLDINPLALGHTLVIPKQEIDYIFDLPDDIYVHLWQFAKKVALAIGDAIECERVGVAVVGLEVPHAHIHLVPLRGVGDLSFNKPRLRLTEGEFREIAVRIVEAYRRRWGG